MKRTLLFIACVLTSLTLSAQDDLTVGDIQNSGCLAKTRGEESEPIPTIVLTKEGSVLSVQLLNYESNCATADFIVKSNISGGNDGTPCSVNVSVTPYLPGDEVTSCMCPYNVSFTVRDVEANHFYLKCWWYEGLVTLEEREPLVLEDVWEEATIDDVRYTLRKSFGRAKIEDGSTTKGEYRIPSELNYEGRTYSVTSIDYSAFRNNKNLTKVTIPQTVKNMDLSDNVGIDSNPFSGCTALRSIEVEEGNPAVCAIDGVLFNKGKTKLLCYPPDAQLTSYIVPESVTSVAGLAFSYSQHLQKVSLSDKVTSLGASVFYENQSVEEVRMPLKLTNLGNWMFTNCTRLKSVTIPQGVTSIGRNAFQGCTSLTSVTMPESVKEVDYSVFEGCTSLESVTLSPNLEHIMHNMFADCRKLKEIIIPDCVTWIMPNAFKNCSALTSLDLPESVYRMGEMVFAGCKLNSLYIRGIIESLGMSPNIFRDMDTQTKLYVQPSEVEKFQAIYEGPVYPLPEQIFDDMAYRPFIEDGKVWKVGDYSGNPVRRVEYYYFDGDTIIDGKTCKQMMCQRYVNPDYPNYDAVSQLPSLSYVGAWYEENKQVYFCDATDQQFKLMYDFSLEDNGTFQKNDLPYVYVIGPRKTGGIKGFKGVYRDVLELADGKSYKCAPWMEGVGGIYGNPKNNVFNVELGDPGYYLMSCTVGDEVIYLNDDYEDGATPAEARKHRFDFTHTTKIQPKSRNRSGAETEESLYGEYNDHQLCINLDPLDETYQVYITDESGKTVYEKNINAGNIVGLNIDISAYPEGRYTVTVENSQETFKGEFETQTTGIEVVRNKKEVVGDYIYNLSGQRLSTPPAKGIYIRNGKKVVFR